MYQKDWYRKLSKRHFQYQSVVRDGGGILTIAKKRALLPNQVFALKKYVRILRIIRLPSATVYRFFPILTGLKMYLAKYVHACKRILRLERTSSKIR